jgi:hypothetical protein
MTSLKSFFFSKIEESPEFNYSDVIGGNVAFISGQRYNLPIILITHNAY